MKRRHFLSTVVLSILLSGCTEDDGATSTPPTSRATETKTPEAKETKTPGTTATGVEPKCWPSLCEGTALVEVGVANGFSGDVVLVADCRGEELTILSGESTQIDRVEDGETCEVSLFIDGDREFDETIGGYESVTLEVRASGEVDQERVFV